ncbi:MAG: double-strand break repair helicase AddA [Alphaproteobacteria bacterium]|nr:double-strand break repair helicase AddA [Alphaproteobacteria bacterium]
MNAADPIFRANADQRRASRPDASVWVTASAGTGKTKVLTDRVLRLLLAGTAPSRILCLTFTKAAAAEMALRINRQLAEWAVIDESELAATLTDLTGLTPDFGMMATARRLFADGIDAPQGLQIDTLHAFCQSILRRFPLEAGIAPHFEVLDERTASEVLHEAKAQFLLAAAGDDGGLAEAMGVLSGVAHENRFDELIQSLSAERGRFRDLVAGRGGAERLIGDLYLRLGVPPTETEADVLRRACRDDAVDGPALTAAAAALMESTKTDRGRGAVVAAWLGDRDDRVATWDTYVAAFLTAAGSRRKTLIGKEAASRAPQADAVLGAEADRIEAVEASRRVHRTVSATAALIRVGGAILDAYDVLKARRAALDYNDLVLLTRDLLRNAGAVSWVMYKLDEGIDHILIDEAQDTNPEQWQIVAALAGDFFAGETRDTEASPRTIFAVGDAKQSIFSFQRADPAGFAANRARFAELVGHAGQAWDEVDLDISFRSAAAILNAVDAVFAHDTARDGVVGPGLTLGHRPSRLGQAGRVELWPAAAPPEDPEIEAWAPPVDSHVQTDPEQRVAAMVSDRIAGWIETGERLPARDRAVRPGDVMILVRRRGSFVARMVRELKNRGIPVAGVDRMILNEQLAVMDLVALGAFLLLPGDDLTLATVLRSPLIELSETRLYDLAAGRGDRTLWAELTARRADNEDFATAHGRLAQLLATADFVPPFEFYARLLGSGGGRQRLLARLGPEAADAIEEFLSLALVFERSHPPSLQGFLAWFGAGSSEVKRELEQGRRDEVRVMTVHGAKGLQAPIVILPDTLQVPSERGVRLFWDRDVVLWPPRKADDEAIAARLRGEADARRIEEYRRLLYVAMTRAEDRLYICGWETRRAAPAGNWYELARAGMAPPVGSPFPVGDGAGLYIETEQTADAEKTADAVGPMEPTPIADWVTTLPPAEPSPPRPLAPARGDGTEPGLVSPLADGGHIFRRGLLIHKLLELLPETAPAERAPLCRRWLARRGDDLDPEVRTAIVAETLAVLDDPQFAPLFAPGSRAEVALTGIVGDRVVSGRVDRLAVTETEVLVVDYKTNRAPPREIADIPPIYLSQMANYRALLREIYPSKSIRCALLWTDGPGLMAVPDEALDGDVP